VQQPAEREVLGHDERERAGRYRQPDGYFQLAVAVVPSDRSGRHRRVPQGFRDGCERQGREEKAHPDRRDGESHAAPHGLAPAAYLAAEVEGQARAHEQQGRPANPATHRVDARLRGEADRHVRDLHAAEHEQEPELREADGQQGHEGQTVRPRGRGERSPAGGRARAGGEGRSLGKTGGSTS